MMPLSLKSQDLKRRANDILKDAMTRREKTISLYDYFDIEGILPRRNFIS
jgi:hypothetical protein